jgi:hypothetical protein
MPRVATRNIAPSWFVEAACGFVVRGGEEEGGVSARDDDDQERGEERPQKRERDENAPAVAARAAGGRASLRFGATWFVVVDGVLTVFCVCVGLRGGRADLRR